MENKKITIESIIKKLKSIGFKNSININDAIFLKYDSKFGFHYIHKQEIILISYKEAIFKYHVKILDDITVKVNSKELIELDNTINKLFKYELRKLSIRKLENVY